MHYINQNEDILVSFEKEIPEGFFALPSIDSYWLGHTLANNSLFIAAKCYSEAYKEFKEASADMTYCKWLDTYGYKHLDGFAYILAQEEIYKKAGHYKEYYILNLACKYGGNKKGFNILKPFIVPKEHIIAKWDSEKVNKFIQNLLDNGFINIGFK